MQTLSRRATPNAGHHRSRKANPQSHPQPGIVPSPLFTTLMQVASRLFLMWLVTYPFPSVTTSPAYSSMLCAWSLTELIRYGYFTAKLTGGDASPPPYWLHWLRYSAFIVLYPVGISSELVEVYLAATGPARGLAWWAPYALAAAAAVYAPGEFFCGTPERLRWLFFARRN